MVSDIVARATRDTLVRSYVSGFHFCWSAFDHYVKMHISLNQLIKPPAKSVYLKRKQPPTPRSLTIFSRCIHCWQWTFIWSSGQQRVNNELDKANLTSTWLPSWHCKSFFSFRNICWQFYFTEVEPSSAHTYNLASLQTT